MEKNEIIQENKVNENSNSDINFNKQKPNYTLSKNIINTYNSKNILFIIIIYK